jgi:hypothetical protein
MLAVTDIRQRVDCFAVQDDGGSAVASGRTAVSSVAACSSSSGRPVRSSFWQSVGSGARRSWTR